METDPILCTNCRHINYEEREICALCGSPIGAWTSVSRMEGILTGKFQSQAAARPTKLIIVIGVWVMFLPAALVFSYQSIVLFSDRSFIAAFLVACFAALFIAVLIKTTKNYIRNRKVE